MVGDGVSMSNWDDQAFPIPLNTEVILPKVTGLPPQYVSYLINKDLGS